MRNELAAGLHAWIAAGGREIGEVYLATTEVGFELCHRTDLGRTDLKYFAGAEAARDLAHYDDGGKFRPLKTAPNLRRGWLLKIADIAELRRALDYFYPAMVGLWHSHTHGSLAPVPLRATLARQTGMYRVTQKITDDQVQHLIGNFCRSDIGCLKRILWPLAPGVPITTLPPEKFSPDAPHGALPLLCQEACNLLVAQARTVVKKGEVPP